MRARKRLNILVSILMLVFFAGSAFAYNMLELIEFNRVVSLSGPLLTVNPDSIGVNKTGGGTGHIDAANISAGDGRTIIPFYVYFTGSGQSVAFYMDIYNNSPEAVVIGSASGGGSASLPDWMRFNYELSPEAIPSGGSRGLEFTVLADLDYNSIQGHRFNETVSFGFILTGNLSGGGGGTTEPSDPVIPAEPAAPRVPVIPRASVSPRALAASLAPAIPAAPAASTELIPAGAGTDDTIIIDDPAQADTASDTDVTLFGDPGVPLGAYNEETRENPQTGDSGVTIRILLLQLIGLSLMAAAFIIYRRRKARLKGKRS